MEKLNVIINTFNDVEYLDKIAKNYAILYRADCVEKIIIVSDGSDDEFNKQLEAMFDRDSVLILGENIGVHRARMAAVELLNEGHCMFVDSDDDILEPFEYYGVGVYDFIGYDVASGTSTYEFGFKNSGTKLSKQIIKNEVSGVLWNKIFDVKQLKKIPDISLRNGEDYFSCLWLSEYIDTLVSYDKPLLQYNVRPNSLSKRPSRYKYSDLAKMLKFLRSAKRISYGDYLRLYLNLVIKNFIRSFKHSPNRHGEISSFVEIFKCQ